MSTAFLTFDQVDPREVSWLWPAYIARGAINLIVGRKDVGKTTAACWLAAKTTTELGGRAFVDTTEDDIHVTLRPRIEAAGADLGRVVTRDPQVTPAWQFGKDDTAVREFIAFLQAEREHNRKPDLVVFDSLSGFVPGYTANTVAGPVLDQLTVVAQAFDLAIVFIHHFAKAGKTLDSAIGGAGAITRVARIVHVFGKEPVDELMMLFKGLASLLPGVDPDGDVQDSEKFVLACYKMNLAPKPASVIFEGDTATTAEVQSVRILREIGLCAHTAEQVFAAMHHGDKVDFKSSAERSELEHAIQWIVETLAEREQRMAPTKQLIFEAAEHGIAKRTFERARAELGCETIPPARLRDHLGDQVDGLSDEQRKAWWMKLELPDTPPAAWNGDDE